MKHLLNHPSSQPLFGDRKIIISNRPSNTTGLDFATHTRVFFFKSKPNKFLVDFIEQDINDNAVCLVPSNHLHYLSPTEDCRFFCVDIHDSLFSNWDLQYIYASKFHKQKTIQLSTSSSEIFHTLENMEGANFDEKYYLNYIKSTIVHKESSSNLLRLNPGTILLITQFLEHIKRIELKLDNCVIAQIVGTLNCSERTLQRACINSFGLTTQEVIKYHILLKGIYLLSKHESSISSISKELGFSSVSSFDKCIKRLTNSTPKAIQQHLHSIGL